MTENKGNGFWAFLTLALVGGGVYYITKYHSRTPQKIPCLRGFNFQSIEFLLSQSRPRPIFRTLCRETIVGAEAFHFSVRNGKRWSHLALMTETQKVKLFYINFSWPLN